MCRLAIRMRRRMSDCGLPQRREPLVGTEFGARAMDARMSLGRQPPPEASLASTNVRPTRSS